MSDAEPVVLVVEDEPDVAETYALWLEADHEVRRAASGEAALETLDDDVDVVLLDRMMPGMSGDEVLERIRERGVDVRVAMVTAVDPDFDVVAMGFDDYVTKPPRREQLRDTVADLLERADYQERVREFRSLATKRALLEAEKTPAELEGSEAYASLEADIAAARAALAEDSEQLADDVGFLATLRDATAESEAGEEP